jgi:hypothetical protein
MILGLISAQFIGVARACGSNSGTVSGPAQAAPVMPADCPIMAVTVPSTATVCDAHCVAREQADKSPDPRVAQLAPANALVVRVEPPAGSIAARATPPRACIASPPLAVLFGRFLI